MRVVTLGALGEGEEVLATDAADVTIVDGNGITITEGQLAGLRTYIYGGTALMAAFLGFAAYKKVGG